MTPYLIPGLFLLVTLLGLAYALHITKPQRPVETRKPKYSPFSRKHSQVVSLAHLADNRFDLVKARIESSHSVTRPSAQRLISSAEEKLRLAKTHFLADDFDAAEPLFNDALTLIDEAETKLGD